MGKNPYRFITEGWAHDVSCADIKKLKEIETNLPNQTIFMDSEAKMLLLKKDIEKIMEEKTKGAMIWCRADWVESGEKSSRCFLNLEKHNFNTKLLNVVQDNRWNKIHGRDKILKELERFYTEPYSMHPVDLFDLEFLETLNLP